MINPVKKLFSEKNKEVGFEEAAPNVEAKEISINEAITEIQKIRNLATVELNIKEDRQLIALDMAIDALFHEMIAAERFKSFSKKYGIYSEENDDEH